MIENILHANENKKIARVAKQNLKKGYYKMQSRLHNNEGINPVTEYKPF